MHTIQLIVEHNDVDLSKGIATVILRFFSKGCFCVFNCHVSVVCTDEAIIMVKPPIEKQ